MFLNYNSPSSTCLGDFIFGTKALQPIVMNPLHRNTKDSQLGVSPPSNLPITVFISSTFLDNEERRKLVEDAIIRAKMLPVGMERFTASEDPIVEECQRQARECDVFLGIIAHRYGWIPDGLEFSITELEYDAAKLAGRPRLMFEIAASVLIDREKDYDQGANRWAKQEKLDAFKTKYAKDQMPARFEENRLSGMVVQALHDWNKKHKVGNTAPATKPEADGLGPELDRYREVVETQHKEIPLAGFKTRLRVPIDLEELYVPLQASVDLRGTGACLFADAADAEAKLGSHGSAEIALIDAFREAHARKRHNLVILGDPGSGKTTHLKRLLLACLRQGPDWLGLPDDLLPVFLPLRELEDLNQGIDAFIEKTLDSPHLNMPQGFGKRLLERGRLLLLFDGLDEVSDSKQRAKVADWIDSAVQALPACTAVVTCRFAGYDEDSQLEAGFLELHLRPMTQEQAENFIRNWYKAVETGLTPGPSGAIKAAEKAEELVGRLREPDSRSTRMAEMTRNPLLLANLCLVHRDRGGILPKGRHELYDECIAVLLELWRQHKSIGQGRSLSVSIPAQTGRRALQPVALWLHGEDKRTRATAEELAPVLEPALKAAQWRNGDARQFLQTLRDESGLLTGWSHGQYGFMHLGFQEYLAACELRRLALAEALDGGKRDILSELAGHYGESWWNEVILLLLAQGNPSLFAPFMAEALKQARFAEDSAFLDLILEETAEFSPAPFLELLRHEPGNDTVLWANQAAALRVLQRLAPDEVKPVVVGVVGSIEVETYALGVVYVAPVAQTSYRTNNGGVELLLIPGGRFMMGSAEGEGNDSERPAHAVDIRPFHLGRYPVTNEEYGLFLQAYPEEKQPALWADRRFNQARQPVIGINWDTACRFAHWAGGRLPTEAEWEYAVRAGGTSQFFWGESVADADNYAWFSSNSQGTTHPVGEKRPNAFGLSDMAGNVWECVQDRWHDDYQGAPGDGSAWEDGGGSRRVVRGGSWFIFPRYLRSAGRNGLSADVAINMYLGFRLARAL
ncbi:MAG: SUMF1/EgtB/PvdO family nonheme iron enzyme [Candidatus Methylumidiphilus sp.]